MWLAGRLYWRTASAPPAEDGPKDVTVAQAMLHVTPQSVPNASWPSITDSTSLSVFISTAAATYIYHSFTLQQTLFLKEESTDSPSQIFLFFFSILTFSSNKNCFPGLKKPEILRLFIYSFKSPTVSCKRRYILCLFFWSNFLLLFL